MAAATKEKEAIPAELAVRSKRYRESFKNYTQQALSVEEAVAKLKTYKGTKFDQSVEVIFSLGIDPKQADQMIRSSVSFGTNAWLVPRAIAASGDFNICSTTGCRPSEISSTSPSSSVGRQ